VGEMEGNNSNVLFRHHLKELQKNRVFHLMMLPVTKIVFAGGR
jgi:hypothetical protein